MKLRPLVLAVAVSASASTAEAHVRLLFPMRNAAGDMDQKGPAPCGNNKVRVPNAKNTFRPGETITVSWSETVLHVGHFRVAIDDDGRDFPAPTMRKETSATLP